MPYADHLRALFPTLELDVADLFALEAHQVAELPTRAPDKALAAVLHAHPAVRTFLEVRDPAVASHLARVVVDPQDVVVLGGTDGPHQLDLEAGRARGQDGVPRLEGPLQRPLDQGVQLVLAVVVLVSDSEGEGQPDLALVPVPMILDAPAAPLEEVEQPVEGPQGIPALLRAQPSQPIERLSEPQPRRTPESAQGVGLLEASDEAVVGQEDLVQEGFAGQVGHLPAPLRIHRRGKGAVNRIVVVPALLHEGVPLRVLGVGRVEGGLDLLQSAPELLDGPEVAGVVLVGEEVCVHDQPEPCVS